jgi:hypothetical protein
VGADPEASGTGSSWKAGVKHDAKPRQPAVAAVAADLRGSEAWEAAAACPSSESLVSLESRPLCWCRSRMDRGPPDSRRCGEAQGVWAPR